MATNRFDKPIESEYISQYTPIPFEQLYAIGKANNERVDKAYQDLGNQFTKWSEFRSPSAIDTKRWYDLTVGAGQDIVNKLAANPDLIKTAEGRSLIQSFINTRPYNELSQLQQSKEGLLQRQKVNQQLMLSGKYNPLWHEVDFTNYNTLDSGVFNDVAPLAYKSEVDLVKPYVDNLKAGYIRSDDSYDYSGVSTDRTDEQIAKNISAIYNTPEAQMHINALVRQGFTPDQARALFTDRIYRAGREFAYEDREANEFAKLEYSNRLKAARTSQNVSNEGPWYLTDSLEYTGLQKFNNARNYYLSNNPNYEKLKSDINSNDPVVREMASKQLRSLADSATPYNMFRDIMRKYGTEKNGKLQITNTDIDYAVNDIFNNFGYTIRNSKLNDLLSSTIQGITENEQSTPLGRRKIISGGENLNLMSRVISEIAGFEAVDPNRNKVINALKGGKFNNMILLNNDNMITIPVVKNGQPSTVNLQRIKVAISEDDIKNAGLTEDDMKKAGATIQTSKQSISESETSNLSGKTSGERSELGEQIAKKWSSNTTRTVRPGVKYYVLNLSNSVPTSGDDLNAEYLNQQALKLNVTGSVASGLYPDVQNKSFGFR